MIGGNFMIVMRVSEDGKARASKLADAIITCTVLVVLIRKKSMAIKLHKFT